MTHSRDLFGMPRHACKLAGTISILAFLAACDEPLDFDLRGQAGVFSTTEAAKNAKVTPPTPDARGVISYPGYQVAVANRGDTVQTVADRVRADATQIARFNGIPVDAKLRAGEIIALPTRVAQHISTVPKVDAPASVDVTTLAGDAINKAPATTPVAQQQAKQGGFEPVRHKVASGETAYSIARLYKVDVRDLARWNSLPASLALREGQFLLIPPAGIAPEPSPETVPGEGTPTPQPPSASKALPESTDLPPAAPKSSKAAQEAAAKAEAAKQKAAPVADTGSQTKAAPEGRFSFPVKGTIIRDYAKGRNEGINIKAAPGTAVRAADAGTVAAITESSDGVPIIVVRHADSLLTVYANVTDVAVKKGSKVKRGQAIAKLRSGDQSFVHFEVRKGFDSVDPNRYLK